MEKFIVLFAVVFFAVFMSVVMKIVNKIRGNSDEEESSASIEQTEQKKEEVAPKKKSFMEKYCNDQKNDSRKALANYILIHDKEARKEREDSEK